MKKTSTRKTIKKLKQHMFTTGLTALQLSLLNREKGRNGSSWYKWTIFGIPILLRWPNNFSFRKCWRTMWEL